jgi:hypothetical protein
MQFNTASKPQSTTHPLAQVYESMKEQGAEVSKYKHKSDYQEQ